MILFVIMCRGPIFGTIASLGILDRPFAMETTMIRNPAKVENIRIKPVGVGLPRELKALSISKALIMKANPKILKTNATASFVNPKKLAKLVATRSAPGTPRKNFEYRGSYASIFRYLPRTA
jgi:hypothetical protein